MCQYPQVVYYSDVFHISTLIDFGPYKYHMRFLTELNHDNSLELNAALGFS